MAGSDKPHSGNDFSLNQIDLNLLRIFDVLMQERSVTKAAQRTGRTQSAVSHSLNKLREILNDELFVRDSRMMEPTPRAKELSVVISRALADIRHVIDQHLHFVPGETTRNFVIGLSDYTAVAFLPRLVQVFSREAPCATLKILHVRETEIPSLLKAREIDCAILGNTTLSAEHLTKDLLSQDKMVCAGWSGNRILESMTADRYLESPHLQISSDGVAGGVVDVELGRLGLSRKVVATIPHYLVAPWVINGTELITVFGDSVLLALPEESEIRIVEPPISLPDVEVSLIFDRDLEFDPGHAWLRGIIKALSDEQKQRKEGAYRGFGYET